MAIHSGSEAIRSAWTLPDDVTYLNHGSFGPSPRVVQQERQAWSEQLERQPMDFFVRRMEVHLDAATEQLAKFVDADPANLAFMDNATAAMNVVAATVKLESGDEVLCTDHEYGAVMRIWRMACAKAGANLIVQRLPFPLADANEAVDTLLQGVTPRTKLIVVSHVTSPTAVILPVAAICRAAKSRGIPVCIDGPHAIAMVPLSLRTLGCDFYCASGHKWLCGPFGSGFLYVAPKWHSKIEPAVVSWGGSIAGRPTNWKDEFTWIGTRDPAPFLAIPAAIDFLQSYGVDRFRQETHELARYARENVANLTGIEPFIPDTNDWYGSMAAMPLTEKHCEALAPGQRDPLQDALWNRHKIEVPLPRWHGRRLIRVSCHLYNSRDDVDRLVDALRELLPLHPA